MLINEDLYQKHTIYGYISFKIKWVIKLRVMALWGYKKMIFLQKKKIKPILIDGLKFWFLFVYFIWSWVIPGGSYKNTTYW